MVSSPIIHGYCRIVKQRLSAAEGGGAEFHERLPVVLELGELPTPQSNLPEKQAPGVGTEAAPG